jgi:hypothetical protein
LMSMFYILPSFHVTINQNRALYPRPERRGFTAPGIRARNGRKGTPQVHVCDDKSLAALFVAVNYSGLDPASARDIEPIVTCNGHVVLVLNAKALHFKTCLVCGFDEYQPNPDGRIWLKPDLCSSCGEEADGIEEKLCVNGR